jgi:hypothetical protein
MRRMICWLFHNTETFKRVRPTSTLAECPKCGERWITFE